MTAGATPITVEHPADRGYPRADEGIGSLEYLPESPASPAARFVAMYVVLGASAVFILNGADLHSWLAMWLRRDGLQRTVRTFMDMPGGVTYSLAALFAFYPALLVAGVWAATGRLLRWPLVISAVLVMIAAAAYMPANSPGFGAWHTSPLDLRLYFDAISKGSPHHVAAGMHTIIAAGLFVWVLLSIPRAATRRIRGGAKGFRHPADPATRGLFLRIALASAVVSALPVQFALNLWEIIQRSGWTRVLEALAALSIPLWTTVLALLAVPLVLTALVVWFSRGRVLRWLIAGALLFASAPAAGLLYSLLRYGSRQAIEVSGIVIAHLGVAILLVLPVARSAFSPTPQAPINR